MAETEKILSGIIRNPQRMQTSVQEALRYAGVREAEYGPWKNRMEKLLEKAADCSRFRITIRIFPLEKTEDGIRLEGSPMILPGNLAGRMLQTCDQVLVLGATLGSGFDRELSRLQLVSMPDALLFDAAGSALIDACLDVWQQNWLNAENQRRKDRDASEAPLYLSDRFSPGYGDLPLSLQPSIAALLDLPRQTGIFVHPSMMLSPAKSVTALIGLSRTLQPAKIRGCGFCSMQKTCALRKKGTSCHA